MTAPHEGRLVVPEDPHSGRSLWYGLIVPPAAWAAQEWLGWYFGERTCSGMEPPSVRWILLGVSVAALVAVLVGVGRGWQAWRETAADPDHRDRVDFMAFGGLLVSGVFAIAIVWGGLSTAFLSGCGWMR